MQDQESTNTIGSIIEPDPIGFDFGAPGWTLLFVFLILIILIFIFFKVRQYRRMAYRRTAISSIESLLASNQPTDQIIYKVASLLKQVSIHSYGRSDTVNRFGAAWLDFLEQKSGDQKTFSSESTDIITKGIYQGSSANFTADEVRTFGKESINWIKDHHV